MPMSDHTALGCLSTMGLGAALALFALNRACDNINAEYEAKKMAEVAQHAANLADAKRADDLYRLKQKVKEVQDAQAKAAVRSEALAALTMGGAGARQRAVVACAKGFDGCPGATRSPDVIYEAARTASERKLLQASFAAIERQEERANASLRCCDGSDSPSCTCGSPRRGCCSHHGGVCGCSAD